MNYFYNTLLLSILTVFIAGCGSKQLTVKSLQPSLITDKKIYSVILEDFENDKINQTNFIEEKLVNKVVDGKRVFNLQTNYNNIDAIITGEIIQSSVYVNVYYEEDTNYTRCVQYRYDKDSKKRTCIRYENRIIPCEERTYNVKTQVQVLNNIEKILFSKIYQKSKNIRQCYPNHYYFSPYYGHMPSYISQDRNEYEINSQLAKYIAEDIIQDISPHYIYQNITIIEELDEKNSIYTEKLKKEFENIVELLDNGNIDISQTKLHKLNMQVNRKSYEVIYNLALTYEANNELLKARNYYIEAKEVCNNIENLKLIDLAINRTQTNLENKIKAKSQLP